jgi:hypothetical protein
VCVCVLYVCGGVVVFVCGVCVWRGGGVMLEKKHQV